MAVTVSTAADRLGRERVASRARALNIEAAALTMTACLTLAAAAAVYNARMSAAEATRAPLPGAAAVDLNHQLGPRQIETLAGALRSFPEPAERMFVARTILGFAADENRALPNVGALSRIAVGHSHIEANPSLSRLRDRLQSVRSRSHDSTLTDLAVPLLTAAEIRELKPFVIVREPSEFRRAFVTSLALLLGAFAAAHAGRRLLPGRGGDGVLLPLVALLCGVGFVTMASIPDPLRDRLLLKPFAQGVAAGCAVLLAFNAFDFQRSPLRRFSYVPLVAALALSMLLVLFGTGPAGSGAKVNLLGVQPVEAIRLLVVLFLAGYFARRWELLRDLNEDVKDAPLVRWFAVPRLDYLVPVIAGMSLVLAFFFLQKDLGPALVLGTLFLTLYGIARQRIVLVGAGFAMLIGGVWLGYVIGIPSTVAQRIDMWRSPWENGIRGGDQLAQSLWAFAAGGWWGMGAGRGSPAVIPAGHTDLVLAAVGEEWGFIGILIVLLLFLALVIRGVRIALRAPGDYTMFLSLGLMLCLVLQALLIASGVLGLLPLSGVVTPFLSSGRSSMIANFAAIGVLLSIADRERQTEGVRSPFAHPVRSLGFVLGIAGLAVLAKVSVVQVVRADSVVAASVLGLQADGGRRYQYNPRLVAAANAITRGTIFDRNGIPLATSRQDVLQTHRRVLGELGAQIPTRCGDIDRRCYPFGGVAFHLLGDRESGINWGATNTSFQERDSDDRLRGFDDHAQIVTVRNTDGSTSRVIRRTYAELVPLLRSRHGADDEAVRTIMERPRDVHMSVDIRLQTKLALILRRHMEAGAHERAAVIVLDPLNGDLLAAVSYPWPDAPAASRSTDEAIEHEDEAWLDRARYGLYPPGSTFKLVTAAAALRHRTAAGDPTFTCARLPDGRVGQRVNGRVVRDDPTDTIPHGTIDMQRALVVSCNAYFAQLGVRLGADALRDTADLFGIAAAAPDTADQLRRTLVQAAYGQGQVLVTPYKMARVAATIAAGGVMAPGRSVLDASSQRIDPPTVVLDAADARTLAQAMRLAVTSGTGRALAALPVAVAGKTGTAEVDGRTSHAWFAGFAPYGAAKGDRRIAFAVLVENGGYGARAAAPIAGELVMLARQLGLIKAE